jgi:hypothetical protein
MANKYPKKYPIALAIREMQITPVRIATLKKTTSNAGKDEGECVKKLILVHYR